MTSGNVSDEPIAFIDDDALERLGRDRRRCSSSTTARSTRAPTTRSSARSTAAAPEPLLIRRSRGYVPASARDLPVEPPRPILGCGAELKSTFCLAKGDRAWVGHHIGDLKNCETLTLVPRRDRALRAPVRGRARARRPRPPPRLPLDPLRARARGRRDASRVQHHHAHLAACLAEHGEGGPAVGAIFDGTGYGPDGTVWGGELLVGGLGALRARRAAVPGAAARAATPPIARAVADGVRLARRGARRASARRSRRRSRAEVDGRRLGGGRASSPPAALGSPLTTSAGRLFDAVAALCGLRARVSHEGQAAAELEGLADPSERGAYPFELAGAGDEPAILDPREAIRALGADLGCGRRRRGRRGALSQRARGRDRRGLRAEAEAPRPAPGGPLRRRVPEPAPARARERRVCGRAGSRCCCPSACPPTTARSPSDRSRSQFLAPPTDPIRTLRR